MKVKLPIKQTETTENNLENLTQLQNPNPLTKLPLATSLKQIQIGGLLHIACLNSSECLN